MVISRRKRRENKEISVYLNNKLLEQVQKIKYLGIIFDGKLNFREHVMYVSNKCTKLIHAFIKVRKTAMGTKPRSSLHHIQRSNFTTTAVRGAGMDRGTG